MYFTPHHKSKRVVNMDFKKILILLIATTFIILFLSSASAKIMNDTNLTDNTNSSDKIGCCSVVIQLEGNESVISFRRDADDEADINITEETWNGIQVLKQYKESGGYFVQVIITSDGWVLGYGGKDDGDYNKEIENITKDMVNHKNINDEDLQKIQDIKKGFRLGHVVIKAPNGDYGVAMADRHFKGHLEKGDYLSIPNRYKYVRFGTLDDPTHPVESAIKLATSDVFGLNRRDIMTYHYKPINNDTYSGAKIDLFVSNDDGSMHNLNNGNLVDNFYFNGKFHNKTEIPTAPEKMYVGSQMFESTNENQTLSAILLIVSIIAIFLIYLKLDYKKRR